MRRPADTPNPPPEYDATLLDVGATLAPGRRVDRFVVEGVLGMGGMASVFRVRHVDLGATFALKVLKSDGHGFTDRILREGRLQASMRHPHVVRVYDLIEVAGRPGLIMEYVAGTTLATHLRRGGRMPIPVAVRMFAEIVGAMRYVHACGLVHRDLKPANILMDTLYERLVPRIADFGIAKLLLNERQDISEPTLTQTGVGVGTPPYMPPEQIRDAKSVDERADIFALGCIFYQMVTGTKAFVAPDVIRLYAAIARGEFRPPEALVPDLPQPIVDVIRASLRPDRAERLANCDGILALLSQLPDSERLLRGAYGTRFGSVNRGRRQTPETERDRVAEPTPSTLRTQPVFDGVSTHRSRLETGVAVALLAGLLLLLLFGLFG